MRGATAYLLVSIVSIWLGTVYGARPAYADDGGISFGGTPHLLNGHASVSMKSELIRMDIHAEKITVDCQFVFHNASNAKVTVRMGFPDEGTGAEEPYQGEPLPPLAKMKATFLSYESFVDGKKVPTELVRTKDRTLFWHAKSVTFAPNKDCLIHDIYTLKPGAQVTMENGFYRQTKYILHTGSSWHGPIEKATVVITFGADTVKPPLVLKGRSEVDKDLQNLKWTALPKGTLIWTGPGKPSVKENVVTFVARDLKPTKNDDIQLFYGFQLTTNMQ